MSTKPLVTDADRQAYDRVAALPNDRRRKNMKCTPKQRKKIADHHLSHEVLWRIMRTCAAPKVARAIRMAERATASPYDASGAALKEYPGE